MLTDTVLAGVVVAARRVPYGREAGTRQIMKQSLSYLSTDILDFFQRLHYSFNNVFCIQVFISKASHFLFQHHITVIHPSERERAYIILMNFT